MSIIKNVTVSNGSISFGSTRAKSGDFNWHDQNDYAGTIPYRVYGIKGVS